MIGKLYVVSTPIGNLKDITLRAIEVLKGVGVIVCEDTRHSRILLKHYEIEKSLTPLFKGNEDRKTQGILGRLQRGEDVALISSAGTPNISDPGYRLISGAQEKGVPVVTVPGVSAVISALSISGLPTDSFIFEGFLPVKEGKRRKLMASWKEEKRTIVYYESPHRLIRSLEDLKHVFGNIRIVIARELTKKFEEIRRESIDQALEHFQSQKPLGEFVLLLNLK